MNSRVAILKESNGILAKQINRKLQGDFLMEYRKFEDIYVMRIDKGEEIVETLKNFCRKKHIKAGWIKGIGAVNDVTIGLFETKSKNYLSKRLKGDFEITSLVGNISYMAGNPYLHLHINIAGSDYIVHGGHLDSAVVSATCEITIKTIEGEIGRQFDETIGLNLYKF